MAGRPWIKLHTRWLTSPTHAHLDAYTLGVGALLMLLIADQGEDDGEGGRWLRTPIYHPGNTADDVTGSALRAVHCRVDRGRRLVDTLVKVGSLAVNAQGHLGFPKWMKWQEHPSAKSKRKARSQSVTVNSEVEVEEDGEGDVDQKRQKIDLAASIRTSDHDPSAEYALLKEWSVYGNDPAGLGAWPDTETPTGVKVRRLIPTAKLADMVAPGKYTAAEVHEVVHGLAAMVRAGAFPAAKYTPSFVFSGYFAGECLQPLREWQAKEARKAEDEEKARMNAPFQYTDEQKKDLVF